MVALGFVVVIAIIIDCVCVFVCMGGGEESNAYLCTVWAPTVLLVLHTGPRHLTFTFDNSNFLQI